MICKSFLLFVLLAVPVSAQADAPTNPYYLNTRQRFHDYTFRTYTDPQRFAWLLVDSAQQTLSRDPHEWNRSAESYSWRVASGWGRRVVRNTAQFGFETVLHEDSRYQPSNLHDFRKRFLFAVSRSVMAYKPDGSSGPAYGRMAAGVVAMATASTWHPQHIGPGDLLNGVWQASLDRAGNNLLTEFTPDLKAFGRRVWNQFKTK